MKSFLLVALCGALTSLHAGVRIDFGMNGSTPPGHPDQRTSGGSPVYNNLAIGASTGGALAAGAPVLIAQEGGLPTLSSAALTDTAGAASGWSISFSSTGTGTNNIGTAGTGGNYSGTVAPDALALLAATSATRDSLYVNTNGVTLTVTISGLNNAARYDLTAFSGRNAASAGGAWTLSTGTPAIARFQNSAGTYTGNTGQTIANGGTNAGIAVEWRNVAPSGGMIAFQMAAKSSNPVDLNALALEPVGGGEAVDVYLLGGQSNMQGLGLISELTPAQKAAPAGVFFWSSGGAFVPLVPGTTATAGGTPNTSATEFGPEIAFATEIAKLGRPAYLVKSYRSGTALDAGWSDQVWAGGFGSNRYNFYAGTSATDTNRGLSYIAMVNSFSAALAAITASGDTPVVKGLLWMQGEQDSKNEVSAAAWAANLKHLRDRLVQDLGLVSLPVVIAQVLPYGSQPGETPQTATFPYRTEVRASQLSADRASGTADAVTNAKVLSTDGIPVYDPSAGKGNYVHFTTAGQLALGTAFATSLEALLDAPPQPIHIAFHSSTATRDAMAPAVAPTAQGTRVNTAADTWNNVQNSAAHTFSNVPLHYAGGLSSGALLGGSTGYTGTAANGWAARTKDSVMMDGWFGFAGSESLTVSNLPAGVAEKFHVIVYGDADSTRTMNYTIGGTTKTIQDAGTFGGTFTEGSHFVMFTGLTGTSFTLTGNATTPRSAVGGLSIIPGDPPAPPVIVSFTAADQYVAPGTQVALAWNVTGADSLSISPTVGTVSGGTGSANVTVQQSTTFTLTATNSEGTATESVRIAAGPARPNIVVFLVDDMGWQDTSVPFQFDAAGNPVVTGFNQRYRTPNMESLAASGMRFTNAYSCAVCSPTRISLLTGQSAARHRVTQWTLYQNTDESGVSANLKSPLAWNVNGVAPGTDATSSRVWRTSETLPRRLQQAGYRTIHAGKAHFGTDGLPGEDPLAQGFDVNIAGHAAGAPASYLGTDNYGTGIFHVPGLEAYHGTDTFLTEAITLEAKKAVQQAVADGTPFYLYMAHYAIHVPLALDARFAANYPGVDATETKYASMIEGMDKSLGDIRAKLDALGVAENTLILFYSDNGGLSASSRGTTPGGTGTNTHNKPLRAGKGSAYEGGIRVPAIAGWAHPNPSNAFQQALPIAANSRCDKPVIVEDLYPTVLDIAGVGAPSGIDGRSVTGYLKNDPTFQRPVSLLFHYPHIWSNGYIAMNQGYEMHSTLREGDWKIIHYYEGSRWELYDLANDLGEANNLAATRPDLVFPLGRKMIRLLREREADYPANRTTNLPQPPVLPNNITVDTDGDGSPDNTEDPNRNGVVDPGETDPDRADTDGDGTPDGAEIRTGTDPLNPASSFRVTPTRDSGGVLSLVWPSKPGAVYEIQASDDLTAWPDILATNFPAATTGSTTRYEVPASAAKHRFFRIRLP